MSADKASRLIPLGVIGAAHGIKGEVKLRSFTAVPENITAYGPLHDASGKVIAITVTGGAGDALIARVAGVTTRQQAESLRNTALFVPRSALPAPKPDEYYHEDLTGLALETETGEKYGVISGMRNFGAGDLALIRRESGAEELLPFTKAIFSRIDFDKGVCVLVPPEVLGDE